MTQSRKADRNDPFWFATFRNFTFACFARSLSLAFFLFLWLTRMLESREWKRYTNILFLFSRCRVSHAFPPWAESSTNDRAARRNRCRRWSRRVNGRGSSLNYARLVLSNSRADLVLETIYGALLCRHANFRRMAVDPWRALEGLLYINQNSCDAIARWMIGLIDRLESFRWQW